MQVTEHTPLSEAPVSGATAKMSDEVLMERVADRDPEALSALYERHGAVAHGLSLRILRDPAEAQEATQDAFLAVWRSGTYKAERGTPRSYILAIVRNRSLDALRRRRSRPTMTAPDPLEHMAAAADTESEAEDHEKTRMLRDALAKLPEAQREAVALAFLGGLSHGDIATRLSEPVGTVKGRIRLGLARLRESVPEDFREPALEAVA